MITLRTYAADFKKYPITSEMLPSLHDAVVAHALLKAMSQLPSSWLRDVLVDAAEILRNDFGIET